MERSGIEAFLIDSREGSRATPPGDTPRSDRSYDDDEKVMRSIFLLDMGTK